MNRGIQVLEKLPLDVRTLKLIEKRLERAESLRFLELARQYEAKKDYKTLENIIHHTYFSWENEIPQHIKAFREHYNELRDFWPYECHRTILGMQSPKSQSIRFLWSAGNPRVLAAMRYGSYGWNREGGGERLTELERTLRFHEIFQHFLFLQRRPQLCKNRKHLSVPIVEIPMKPLGQNIADVRIKNLFKRKVAYVWRILAVDNPALSAENESLLMDIIESPQLPQGQTSSRMLKRLYQRACRGAYVIKPHPTLGLEIEESKILKIQ